ncbi:MAG: copper amine oxidase domain protein [Anaerosolibacter sp.]|uniref:stalk domain-containing protein n=1 Tax=Anaerosolibacter sp. TaxID=1872527 RepID=UPI00262DADC6|nr:stalk domain-containing protein [Anaerosolibacter sp.]MDF2545634.1 copper amine oxidase domain protein [Anaerosolibacter sp.]
MLMNKKKMIVVTIVITMLLLSLNSIGYASQIKKTVDAWYSNIKVVANGAEVAMDVEPFIVDGRTYVPVRAVADIFNKDVQWDGTNYKVIINNKPDPTVTYLYSRIAEKDTQIAALQKQVADLEVQLSKGNGDIDDLENQLNDDYEEYEDIDFKIYLNGDEDDIEVEIYVDLHDFDDEWDALTSSDIKYYLQDIVDDIVDEFEDADIEGYIEDEDSGDTLVDFSVDSDGDVTLDSLNDDADMGDLEDELDDEYYNYFDNFILSVKLDGDEDEITFYVEIAYDDYSDEWEELSTNQIERLMNYIHNDIEDEFDDADIEGYVYDTDNDEYLGDYTYEDGYDPR